MISLIVSVTTGALLYYTGVLDSKTAIVVTIQEFIALDILSHFFFGFDEDFDRHTTKLLTEAYRTVAQEAVRTKDHSLIKFLIRVGQVFGNLEKDSAMSNDVSNPREINIPIKLKRTE